MESVVLPPCHSASEDTYRLQVVCSAVVFVLSVADLAIWSTTTVRRGFEGVSLLLAAYSMAALSFIVSVWTLRAVRFAAVRIGSRAHAWHRRPQRDVGSKMDPSVALPPPPPPGRSGDDTYKLQATFSAVIFVVSVADLAIWGTTSVRAGFEGVSLFLAVYSLAVLSFIVSVWAFRAVKFAAVRIGARAHRGRRQMAMDGGMA